MSYITSGSDTYHQYPSGITFTQKQRDAMAWPLANVTGSLQFTDGDNITDAGGDSRLSFTDAGSLVLYDESGNAGITLNTDQTTTFANSVSITNHITASGNISASGGNVILSLPTSDPEVTGSLFTTGSTSMGIGAITGSGKFLILCVSNG